MENPLTWNEAVKTIDAAIREHTEDSKKGVIGLSLPQTIYNKLIKGGFTIHKNNR